MSMLESARRWTVAIAALAILAIVSVAPGRARATTAVANAGTCVSDSGNSGSAAWGNPQNAEGAPNNSDTFCQGSDCAAIGLNGSALSQFLKCTNFGFSIPPTAVINGISLTIRESADGSALDTEVRVVKGGVVQTAQNKASGSAWHLFTFGTQSYGGAADLWGVTWTAADINATGFGAVMSVTNQTGAAFNLGVDSYEITVDYTVPPAKAPAPALGSPSSAPFVLTALGLALAGVLLLGRRASQK